MPILENEEIDIEELEDDDLIDEKLNSDGTTNNDVSKKTKRTIKDILKIVISNLCVILSGVLTSFVLPKMIGVEDYGNYKIFSLYCTYVDLLQLGIMDGIYLYYGGKNYDELDKSKFRFYTKFFLVFQATITAIMALICFFLLKSDYRFIFLCLSLFIFAYNITYYFQVISQITQRFTELAVRNFIKSLCMGLIIVFLFLMQKFANWDFDYKPYTLMRTGIFVLLMLWYLWTYKDLVIGKSAKWKDEKKNILHFLKIGAPLMIANIATTLIMNIDSQFVSILFDRETYAIYAFAYNMITVITMATSAISTVIYPAMKRTTKDTLTKNFSFLITIITIIMGASLLAYFVFAWFVNWKIDKYNDSLIIFRVVLPGLIASTATTAVMHNYYKVIGKNFIFFVLSLAILGLSIVANIVAYLIFKNTISLSIASVIVLTIWYISSMIYFIKKFKVKFIKNLLYMFLIMAGFYCATIFEGNYLFVGMAIYLAYFIFITLLLNLKEIKNIKLILFNK